MEKKAQRQLKELRRLMPWNWDSRVEEHPPGEKAMHDFEDIVNYRMDGRKRRSHPVVGHAVTMKEKNEKKEEESPVGQVQVEEGVLFDEPSVDVVERTDDDKENMIPRDGGDEKVGIEMMDPVEAEMVTTATGGEVDGEKHGGAADQKMDALSSALAAVQAANDRVAKMEIKDSDTLEDSTSKENASGSPVACESKVAGGLVEVQTPGVCWSGKDGKKKKKRLHDACVTPAVAIVDSQFVLTPGSSSASRKPASLTKDTSHENKSRNNNNKRTQLPDSVIGARKGKRSKQENVVEPLMQAAEMAKSSPEIEDTESLQQLRNVKFSDETKRRDGRKKDGIVMLDDDVHIDLEKYGDGPKVMRPSDCPPLFSSSKTSIEVIEKHAPKPHDGWYKDLPSPGDDVVQPRDATPFKGKSTAAFFDKEKVITGIIQEGINMRSQSLNLPSLPPVQPLNATSKLSVLGSRLSWALGQLASQS